MNLWRRRKFIGAFAYCWVRQRRKTHGAGKAPLLQAALFAWAGAWIASKGFGPNPFTLLWRLTGANHQQPGEQS